MDGGSGVDGGPRAGRRFGRVAGPAEKAERQRAKSTKAKSSNKQEQKQKESTTSLGILVEFPMLFYNAPPCN